jgi:hypothetical protein
VQPLSVFTYFPRQYSVKVADDTKSPRGDFGRLQYFQSDIEGQCLAVANTAAA